MDETPVVRLPPGTSGADFDDAQHPYRRYRVKTNRGVRAMPKGVYDRSKAKKAPEAKAAPAKRGRKPRAEAASSATLTLSGREITVSIDAAGTVSVSVGTP